MFAEGVMRQFGTKCVRVNAINLVQGSLFQGLRVQNICLNGKRLQEEELTKVLDGVDESALLIE